MAWNYNAPETQAAFSDYRQQRKATNESPGLLQQGLEALGRPQRGVFGAIESGLKGQNPFEGFARGFTGSPEEYDPASRLEAAGMGTLPVGPFDTRGLLGFGLGIATDPLTYLPGPGTALKGARYAGLLGRGAQAAERAARVAEAASRAGQVARPAAALIPTIEEGMRTGYQPGLARDVTQAVAKKVPGVKQFLRWTVPRTITDTPVDRALQEADTAADTVARRVELVFMPKLRANPIVSRIDAEGRITGTHGPSVGVFWGDVAQNPSKFADELDLKPKDLEFFQNYKDIWNELRPEYEKVYEEFKKVSPEGSNKYTLTNVHLQEGDDFISRIAEVDGKIDWKPKARPIGPERGVQKPRGVFTGEQGIEAGVDWVTDPLQVASTRITDILAKIGEMQYGIAMADQAKHVMGFGGYEGLRAESAMYAENRTVLRKLQSVLSRISRGETVPSVTLEELRQKHPEIIDAATRMMSQTAVPPVATPLGRAGGTFKGLVEEAATKAEPPPAGFMVRERPKSATDVLVRDKSVRMTKEELAAAQKEAIDWLGRQGGEATAITEAAPLPSAAAAAPLPTGGGISAKVQAARDVFMATPEGKRMQELKDMGSSVFRNPAENKELERLNAKYLDAGLTPKEKAAWAKEMKDARAQDLLEERGAAAYEKAMETGEALPEELLPTAPTATAKPAAGPKGGIYGTVPKKPAPRAPIGEEFLPPPASTRPLTGEAADLLAKVEAGGAPAFMTENLQRIARENGVEVTSTMTPNDVIDALRKVEAARVRPGRPAPGGAAAFTPPRGPLEVRTVPSYKNIKQLQAQARDLLDVQTDSYKASREAYKAARAGEMGDIASKGLQEVARVPMVSGQLFEPEVAARIESHFGAQALPNEILQRAGELSSLARGTQSGYDFGGPALQGLVTLATHPMEWFKGVGQMFKYFGDPQDYQRWLAQPEVNAFFRQHPGLMGSSRYQFETLEQGQLGEKLLRKAGGLPGPLGAVGRGAENLTGRFRAAYEGPLAYMRYEIGKALEHKFVGKERDLDNLVNHMTGVLSAKSLGQGTNQRNVESLMFYSSQYLRASLALVGDMFSPNPQVRDEAMNGIWSLLKVGHLAYDHVSQALGQDPIYDPKDGRFFTWDIGGTRVGVGSNWIALLRLFGRALEDPTSFVNINDVPDNPLVKFVRGRTSPIVSELADLVTNETFTGEPVTNLGEAAKVTGERLLPFGITAGVEGARGAGGLPAGPTELVASMAGLRGFPAGLKDIRNDVSREMFGGDYLDLDPIQKAQVAADPRIKTQEIPPGQRFADERRQREIQTQYGDQLERVATQVNAGTVDKKDFREAVNQARLVRNIQREQIPQKEKTGPRAQADIDRDKYFALLREKDEFGRTNFDAADEFLASLSPTSQEIIKAAEQASLEGLGPQAEALMRELSDARKKLEPYWEVRTTVLERAGLWDEWLDANPHDRRVIEATARYKAAEKIWDARRTAMRLSRPDLDKTLVAWGFATKTMAEQAAAAKGGGGAGPFAMPKMPTASVPKMPGF